MKSSKIPEISFIDNIEDYVKQQGDVQLILKNMNESYNKYKFLEINLLTKKKAIKSKIPDLQHSLKMVDVLEEKKQSELEALTLLNIANNLYCHVKIPPTDKIGLWLGANIMLEFPLDEARQELNKSLKDAQTTLTQIEHDSEFMQKQITTVEVNMARIYNWDVKQRQNSNKDD
ncbi:unnamed protein product [Gordionus sp. m RMFG-2023]